MVLPLATYLKVARHPTYSKCAAPEDSSEQVSESDMFPTLKLLERGLASFRSDFQTSAEEVRRVESRCQEAKEGQKFDTT